MKIGDIHRNPRQSLMYMERLVNKGSPSKFSFKNTTSKSTCPLFVSKYNICKVHDAKDMFISVGYLPEDNDNKEDDFIYLHPDWNQMNPDFQIYYTDIQVCPTSSSRTVLRLDKDYYIKLYYPGVLGRITRELRLEHIHSSIDVTNILLDLVSRHNCPPSLAFLPEKGGKIYKSKIGDVGYIIRDYRPVGQRVNEIKALIPAFALFSMDSMKEDVPIIIQLLRETNNPLEYLLEQLIYPIVDCYFYCVFWGGIHHEMHAQNFLIGIDENINIRSIVLRDLESVDKDITIMKKKRMRVNLDSYPYKCICEQQYNYRIKHSFMYDHKLGEYFFDEIIAILVKYRYAIEGEIEQKIKEYTIGKYGDLLKDFFPANNLWYKFKNELIDRTVEYRPYIGLSNPKYR